MTRRSNFRSQASRDEFPVGAALLILVILALIVIVGLPPPDVAP